MFWDNTSSSSTEKAARIHRIMPNLCVRPYKVTKIATVCAWSWLVDFESLLNFFSLDSIGTQTNHLQLSLITCVRYKANWLLKKRRFWWMSLLFPTLVSLKIFACFWHSDRLTRRSQAGSDTILSTSMSKPTILMTVILDGFNTPNFFSWSCPFPDVQRNTCEQIDEIIGCDRLLVFNDLNYLPYVHSIFKESLRCQLMLLASMLFQCIS